MRWTPSGHPLCTEIWAAGTALLSFCTKVALAVMWRKPLSSSQRSLLLHGINILHPKELGKNSLALGGCEHLSGEHSYYVLCTATGWDHIHSASARHTGSAMGGYLI